MGRLRSLQTLLSIPLLLLPWLASASPGTSAASATEPAGSTIECLPLLPWEQARVDRGGTLWILTGRGEAIQRLDREGRPGQRLEVAGARSFDADSAWGIVTLDRHGRELRWWPAGEAEPVASSLPWEAGHVAWIDGSRVAVSTTTASDAVALVEPSSGRTIAILIGDEEEIRPVPGATLLRSWALAADPERGQLVVVDSLSGQLRVVSLDGRVVGRAQAAAHRLPRILEWLAEVDRQARDEGRVQSPFYVVLRAAVGRNGEPWLVERCSDDREVATLARLTDGDLVRREVRLPGPHCSLNFIQWGDRVVFSTSRSPVSWHCSDPWRRTENVSPD